MDETLEQRFWVKVNVTDGCWLWTASVGTGGYGQIAVRKGTPKAAHLVSLQLAGIDVPAGMSVDHGCHTQDSSCPGGLCVHRRCVRPDHLVLMPLDDNKALGRSPLALNARKTECKRGHALAGDNLKTQMRNGRVQRSCRVCIRDRERSVKRLR